MTIHLFEGECVRCRKGPRVVDDSGLCAWCLGLQRAEQPETRNHSHYYKPVGHLQQLDWYRVASLFEITCPALAHAGKKIAFAGKRGAKDQRRDIQEAIDTLLRKLQMMDEDEKA